MKRKYENRVGARDVRAVRGNAGALRVHLIPFTVWRACQAAKHVSFSVVQPQQASKTIYHNVINSCWECAQEFYDVIVD